MGKVTQQRRGGPGSLKPRTRPLVSTHVACLSHRPAGEREAQRGQVTCPRSLRRRWPRPPDLRGFPSRTPLLPRSGPLQSQLCVRGRAHPPAVRPSARLSGCLRGRSRAPLPSLGGCAGRSRAFAAPSPRPTPHAPRPQPTDGSACARAPPSRCAGAAGAKSRRPAGGAISGSLARSLLSGEAKPASPGNPPSKMKKLQGAHQRKVGQEDGGAHGGGGTPEGGVQRSAPLQAPGGSERAPGPARSSGGGRAELGCKEGRGHGPQGVEGGDKAFQIWGSGCCVMGLGFIGPGPSNRCLQPQEAWGRGGRGQAPAPSQSPTHFPQGLIGAGGVRIAERQP